MPHDPDKKASPAPEAPPAFDFDTLPRVRPNFFLTPDDPPGKPAPQKPTPAQAGETVPEFNPDSLPLVRPTFRVTTDKLGAKRTLQKPAPAPSPRKTSGEDWRARTLVERANEPPPRVEEPASESQAALRTFLDTAEGEIQIETPLAKDDQDRSA